MEEGYTSLLVKINKMQNLCKTWLQCISLRWSVLVEGKITQMLLGLVVFIL